VGTGTISEKPMSSAVVPGQPVPLAVNNFRLKFRGNKSEIHIYNVDFGSGISNEEVKKKSEALRNIKMSHLDKMFGRTFHFDNQLVATQKVE
jgi:hypothetical protein